VIRAILLDIEGTTTSLAFVHDVLFPYSRENLRPFVVHHARDRRIRDVLAATRETVRLEEGRAIDDAAALDALERWIDEDRKHPALKALQGWLWREGYDAGAFRSHVYDDVPGALRRWKDRGLAVAIFSSGSIEAQRLLFASTEAGDLTPLLGAYFDPTTAGPKREAGSYARIADALALAPADVLFLSDIEEELDAARAAGMGTTRIVREAKGSAEAADPPSAHPIARDFAPIER
jgi:enolase-phosphatase E1